MCWDRCPSYTQEHADEVRQSLVFTFFTHGHIVSWEQMSALINQRGIRVTNWLTVRSELQKLINEGLVKRVNGPFVEEYKLIGEAI